MKHLIVATATRPDIIKLAPVIKELDRNQDFFTYDILHGRQHTFLAEQVFDLFNIKPKYSSEDLANEQLNLVDMLCHFSLFYKNIFENIKQDNNIDGIIVHGDVLNSLAAALTSFFYKIPIFHVEAGLRTPEMNYPFPEEGTRRLISKITSLHFAPTRVSERNLFLEGYSPNKVYLTGNTVVDSLKLMLSDDDIYIKVMKDLKENYSHLPLHKFRKDKKNVIFLTMHRREMWNSSLFKDYLRIVSIFASRKSNYQIVFPVHPNPKIVQQAEDFMRDFGHLDNFHIINPAFSYATFVHLLNDYGALVLTDSGGVLEESSILGIPNIILRRDTERPEAQMEFPTYATIVGDDLKLFEHCLYEMTDEPFYKERRPNTLFGNGTAAVIIIKTIKKHLSI